jgi:VanZ family protein
MALILSLSSQSDLPARTNPQTGETIRATFAAAKLFHGFEYSVLALLVLRALTTPKGGVRLALRTAIVVAVVVSGLFGGLDELRQSFVPRREPRLADIAIDTASALGACLLAWAWLRLRRTPQPIPSHSRVPAPPLPHAGEGVGG